MGPGITRSDDPKFQLKPRRWPRRSVDPSGAPKWIYYILWTVLEQRPDVTPVHP